jgi:hypothetical protein
MGAAAALIPGIVGIAGGEYAGYKKRQSEEEMLRNRIASSGRFLGEEQQPQRNSMGVPAPNIEQRNPLAPGIGGESTRRALEERSDSGMARKWALEQAAFGDVGPLNAMTNARMTPEKITPISVVDGGTLVHPITGQVIFENKKTAPVESLEQQSLAYYLKLYNGDMDKALRAIAASKYIAPPVAPKGANLETYTMPDGVQIPIDLNNAADVTKAKEIVAAGGYKGESKRPTEVDRRNDASVLESAQANFDRLASNAGDLYVAKGLPAITGKSALLPTRPGSDAATAEAKLKTVISQSAFETLGALKSAGATLGAVSEAELKLLESNIAALDPRMNLEDFRLAVKEIMDRAGVLKGQIENKYRDKYQLRDNQVPRTVTPFVVGGNNRRIEVLPKQINLNSRYGLKK